MCLNVRFDVWKDVLVMYVWNYEVSLKSTGCGFDPLSRKSNIYLYLYFHFVALVAKRGVEFRHLTRTASRNGRTECLNTGFFAYPAVCKIQRGADLIWFYVWNYIEFLIYYNEILNIKRFNCFLQFPRNKVINWILLELITWTIIK